MKKQKPKTPSEYHGILLVDKPEGITSHDVVDRVRRIFGTRAVGHTGTLDPQATGLLVLLLGEATKISEYLMGVDKSYEGTVKFGIVSDSYDMDGDVLPGPGGAIPTDLAALQEMANAFVGEISQMPPPFSARKVGGKKLYEYARSGETPPQVEPRVVKVGAFELLTLEGDQCEFGVDCGSGTYVRSLAHELGQKAGCGGVLSELRRTDVGAFGIEDARTLEQLEALTTAAERRACLLPIRRALPHLPAVFLLGGAERWLRNGQAIPSSMVHTEDDRPARRGVPTVLCRINGEAIAIAKAEPAPPSPPPRAMAGAPGPWFLPVKLFEIPETRPREEEPEADE